MATIAAATAKERALWMLQQIRPDLGLATVPVAFQVGGPLDAAALQRAVDAVVDRHAALRSTFTESGGQLCRTVAEPGEVVVPIESILAADGVEAAVRELAGRPFDLASSPVRAAHLRAPEGDAFCVVVHHVVFDATSADLVVRELLAAYRGVVLAGSPPDDLLRPGPELEAGAVEPADVDHWTALLRDADDPPGRMRFGRPEPAVADFGAAKASRRLSDEAVSAVARTSRETGTTENMVYLAAYAMLLRAHGVPDNLLLGVPVDLRRGRVPAVGFHVNTLPLRLRVGANDTVRSLLKAVRDVFLDGLRHRSASYEDVVGSLHRRSEEWWVPLFRYLFSHRRLPAAPPQDLLEDRLRYPSVGPGRTRVDLDLTVLSAPERTTAEVVYRTELFHGSQVDAFVARYDALLRSLPAELDERARNVPVLTDQDRLTYAALDLSGRVSPMDQLPRRWMRRAAEDPLATAVDEDGHAVTRSQLVASAARISAQLAACGVGPGDVVALRLRRGAKLAAAVLGSWLNGAAFMPLGPDHPADRLRFQVTDSRAAAVVTDLPVGSWTGDLPVLQVADPVAGEGGWSPGARTDPWTDPESVAYVAYTSGSTGRPKGVSIPHRALANVVGHFAASLGLAREDRVSWLTSFSFDPSALELLMPMVTGATAVVLPDEARSIGRVLLRELDRRAVSVVQATPTTWRQAAECDLSVLAGRRVLSGGEPLSPALAARLVASGCRLYNVYGPTETTIWSTCLEVDRAELARITVGGPISGTSVLVWDADGRMAPPEVSGELLIGGVGTGVGYLGRPELTRERFVFDPRYGRCYRTGDVARATLDGDIELLGREDRQVKLRGHRVELGEVEAVLQEHPAVVDAAALVVEREPEQPALVAFLTGPGDSAGMDEVWRFATARLPTAMVPQRLVAVAELPRNTAQKTDYRRLREQALTDLDASAGVGGDPVEDAASGPILDLWRVVLGRPAIGPHDNFFLNGGQSLLAARLASMVSAVTGGQVPLSAVYAAPTAAEFAAYLSRAQG